MKKTKIAVAVLFAAALAGCYDQVTPQYSQPVAQSAPVVMGAPAAAAPVIVNQAPAHSGAGDMLLGGALGYMMGRSSGGSNVAPYQGDPRHGVRTTTVNKTVVNKTVIVQQAPRQASTPAPAPSFSKGYGAVAATKPTAPSRSFGSGSYGRSTTSFASSRSGRR